MHKNRPTFLLIYLSTVNSVAMNFVGQKKSVPSLNPKRKRVELSWPNSKLGNKNCWYSFMILWHLPLPSPFSDSISYVELIIIIQINYMILHDTWSWLYCAVIECWCVDADIGPQGDLGPRGIYKRRSHLQELLFIVNSFFTPSLLLHHNYFFFDISIGPRMTRPL